MKKHVERILRSSAPPLQSSFGNIDVTHQKAKRAHEVVTELDIQTETYIRDELAKEFPDIPFVGEETGGDRTAKRFWLLDPIDGTGNFVRGIPFCTTMLALIDSGQVIFSAIYNFITDELYIAEKDKGATRNDTPIHVSDRRLDGDAYVFFECNIFKNNNVDTVLAMKKRAPIMATITAGHEALLVAEGKVEARLNKDPFGKDYDYAPGSLLIAEAGGIVTNIGSSTYNYQNMDVIAANPVVYKQLTEGDDAIFPLSEANA